MQGSTKVQETLEVEKCYTNKTSISKSTEAMNDNTKPMVRTEDNNSARYFIAESTQQIHKDFDDVFNGIGCFEGTFSLQLKPRQ